MKKSSAPRALSLILALSLAFLSLLSCTDTAREGSEDSQATVDSSAEKSGDFAELESYVASLAQGGFDGADFTVVGRDTSVLPNDEGETGNLENDALYRRSRALEEAFDIDMHLVKAMGIGYEDAESEINELVRLDVMSDSRSYDLVEGNIMLCSTVLLEENLIQPSENFEQIDPEREWWCSDVRERYTICGKLYYLTGKLNLSNYTAPSCVLYNKQVAEDFGITSLYEAVDEGRWTLDMMTETAGAITAGGDIKRFMIGGAGGGLAMFFGGGFSLSSLDSDGDPVLVESLTSDMVSYIDRLGDIFGDDSITYNQVRAYYNGAEEFVDTDVFEDEQVLYWIDGLGRAITLREYDTEFGILPIPKRDTSQSSYIGFASAWEIKGVFFPKNVRDARMTGAVTEAMAALSEKYIEPEYLERSLKGRSTYDEESKAVVDLLYNSQSAQLVDTYQWGDLVITVNRACLGSIDSYVSGYDSSARLAKLKVDRLLSSVRRRGDS